MKRIEKLTDEQTARFSEWSEKWIDIGLSTEPADFDKFEKAIKSAYGKANITWHNNIVHVSSPIVGALASPIADKLIQAINPSTSGDAVSGAVHGAVDVAVCVAVDDAVRDAVGDAVYVAVGGAVGGAVDVAVGGAVHGAVHGAVLGVVHGAVGDAVYFAVDGAVRGAVDDAVGGAVGGAVGDAVSGVVNEAVNNAVDAAVRHAVGGLKQHIRGNWHKRLGGQFWVGGWWGSPSYISFFTDICGLEFEKDIAERAQAYRDICESVNWFWPNKDFVIVCDRPKTINLDAEGRLHGENGPSIEYRDGWSLYHWHGTQIPKEWITGNPPTAKEALTWVNIEQRRAAAEIVGWHKVLNQLNVTVINKDDDPEVGTLLEAEIPDSGRERFLLVKCGTGRDFVLPVPPETKTALEGNLWTYGIDPDRNFLPEVRT